jgi:hypothetical protein
MGWEIGYDKNWDRFIGYGVTAFCDFPGCNKKINRGLGYVCGAEQPYGGENSCGLYFCSEHLIYHNFRNGCSGLFCPRCANYKMPYKLKPEHPEWINWVLKDKSWKKWREENPELVQLYKLRKLI